MTWRESRPGAAACFFSENSETREGVAVTADGSEGAAGYHVPVLLSEVMHFMAPGKGKLLVDGTLGGGGHTEAMLQAGAQVIGVDQDDQALTYAGERLQGFGERFLALRGNFSEMPELLEQHGESKVDGILVDIGVSSWQLDEAERGFSFAKEGPLDMRMDRSQSQTAADLVNESSEQELKQIFRNYGEERAAGRIARRIVERRAKQAFVSTTDLAEFISSFIPRGGKSHPATRVFQALRIAVNDELGVLERFLENAVKLLRPGGRLVVITFHSLEDRIVKRFMKHVSTPEIDRKEWPAPRPNPDYQFQLLTRKPVIATGQELELNPRARSAKLRAAEKNERIAV
ncbi:16S rRNA (cytosine(1402)-N(4))-methyltransferase RsmH [Verrucomicrobiaceae bacterium N1E253]|uniref:Ribosomal RNA small subunit methyltransferase H n=2 Tax=Oceaniferula marina TaxID=2748318 RepID=A0A851GMM7_9BACT|nr:16S rRNA (cytosine(1402)-N(4))-methyltransferase RsmH [Oceaniferula marina]